MVGHFISRVFLNKLKRSDQEQPPDDTYKGVRQSARLIFRREDYLKRYQQSTSGRRNGGKAVGDGLINGGEDAGGKSVSTFAVT